MDKARKAGLAWEEGAERTITHHVVESVGPQAVGLFRILLGLQRVEVVSPDWVALVLDVVENSCRAAVDAPSDTAAEARTRLPDPASHRPVWAGDIVARLETLEPRISSPLSTEWRARLLSPLPGRRGMFRGIAFEFASRSVRERWRLAIEAGEGSLVSDGTIESRRVVRISEKPCQPNESSHYKRRPILDEIALACAVLRGQLEIEWQSTEAEGHPTIGPDGFRKPIRASQARIRKPSAELDDESSDDRPELTPSHEPQSNFTERAGMKPRESDMLRQQATSRSSLAQIQRASILLDEDSSSDPPLEMVTRDTPPQDKLLGDQLYEERQTPTSISPGAEAPRAKQGTLSDLGENKPPTISDVDPVVKPSTADAYEESIHRGFLRRKRVRVDPGYDNRNTCSRVRVKSWEPPLRPAPRAPHGVDVRIFDRVPKSFSEKSYIRCKEVAR
uniref:BRCT domain-containing protein n=1 Tax=Compsopogon caeruleus TaxID=31354 RepID=A0A7S1X958_9RHOD